MTHLVVEILNNPISLGILSGALIILPILGISIIHGTPNEPNRTRATDNQEGMSGDD
jgi:hypothetical protein